MAYANVSLSPAERSLTHDATDAFRADIDAMRKRAYASVGSHDLRRMRRIEAFSLVCEIVGRLLLHFSATSWVWLAGTLALWLRKQLQVEIGHTVLHGCFDKIDATGRYHSARFRWDAPIEESSWRQGHNLDHHGHTNIVGMDPDVRFGKVRLTDALPYQRDHRFGLFNDLIIWPWFFLSITLHYTGLSSTSVKRIGRRSSAATRSLYARSCPTRSTTSYYSLRLLAPSSGRCFLATSWQKFCAT
jgi:fatty acid desaturase